MTTTKKAPYRERRTPTKAERTRQGSQQANESKATTPPAKCLHWPPTVQADGLPLPGARKLLQDALAWLEVEDARTSLENNTHRMTEDEIASRALVITSPDAPSADLESAWAGDIAVDLPTRDELRARLARYSLPMPEGGPLDVPVLVETEHGRQVLTLTFTTGRAALWPSFGHSPPPVIRAPSST